MNEKNKLTKDPQANYNEHNYPNTNYFDYNNFEDNLPNQNYFEGENNNMNSENYYYNNQEQVFYNNYEPNTFNNMNYDDYNSQNPYYNNDYNHNINGNNDQFFYNNPEQFHNYNNDANKNNGQFFYNNHDQFTNYNNDTGDNNGQFFYNNQEHYSDFEHSDSLNNPIFTDISHKDTEIYLNNNFENMYMQEDFQQEQNHQNTEDIFITKKLHDNQESQKIKEDQDTQENLNNDKPHKSKLGIIITSIIGLFILLSAGGYFGYSYFIKNKEITINMSQYELEFTATGTEGEGKPSVDVKNIPNVDNPTNELKQLLQNPKISYDKNDHLRNGDKVKVSLSLDKSELNGKKIVIKDDFKRSFTVKGLKPKENEKETTVIKESSNNDDANNKSTRRNSRVKDDSSVDTTKLSEEQVKNWVLASLIRDLPDMTKDDYIVSISLNSDNLVYAVISENPNSSKHPSPKMLPTRYRINSKGELEASSRMTDNWSFISKIYSYVE